jgi:hypothetical protein
MEKVIHFLVTWLSNFLDRFKFYRKFLGGDWYFILFHMQTRLLKFWVKRYDGDDLDTMLNSYNPCIHILDSEHYE